MGLKTIYSNVKFFIFLQICILAKMVITFEPDGIFHAVFEFFTAAGVVPCGGRKTSPRTSTIVQFIFYFGPLRSAIIF